MVIRNQVSGIRYQNQSGLIPDPCPLTPVTRLLPPNSTDLEIRLCDTFPRDELGLLADAPRRLKTEPSDVVLPWLASEWFLSGFQKYFPTLRDLIDAGLPWLMERGTAAAVVRALSWIDFPVARIEEDGSRLQLDTGRIVEADELADLIYLTLASIPAHVELYRLYHEYDLRPIGVSQTAALDQGLLSDDSGVWVTVGDEDVKLSFGARISRYLDASGGRRLWRARGDTLFDRIYYEDRARLSIWQLDSEIVPNRNVVQGQIITVYNTVGVEDPYRLGRTLNIARSALDLDDDLDPFGDLNCGFAGGMGIEYKPFVLSDSALSDHDNDVRHLFIDERVSDDRTLTGFLELAPVAAWPMTRAQAYASHFRRGGEYEKAGETWHGAWDVRAWYPRSIQVPVLITESTEPLPDNPDEGN
ncbi:hypothetical protein AGMMS50256_11560 [Betaproteobacteria bacterium]|nr:hypothetical protein AGMMS50256_11560 [Betaproteobacteria bacterium]